MHIILDNGHGLKTPGKRSPDGKLLEYAYTRELARQIVATLKARGYDAELLVPEDDDTPLSDRANRVNAICRAEGIENTILISIHINAAGWKSAACVTPEAQVPLTPESNFRMTPIKS